MRIIAADNHRAVVDYKTGEAIYPEVVVQEVDPFSSAPPSYNIQYPEKIYYENKKISPWTTAISLTRVTYYRRGR